jgi:hypothetical protein
MQNQGVPAAPVSCHGRAKVALTLVDVCCVLNFTHGLIERVTTAPVVMLSTSHVAKSSILATVPKAPELSKSNAV